MEFSGANNSIWILKNHADLSTEEVENSKTIIHPTNEKAIIEIKADKQPVGAYVENIKPFKTSHVKLNKDDVIISFTDGYPDQFGGVKGKKLKYKPFKQFFLDNSSHSLENLKMIHVGVLLGGEKTLAGVRDNTRRAFRDSWGFPLSQNNKQKKNVRFSES